ncbi:hypothetical protein [Albirhodobacter sp. R86504]|jgi:hypothetical protein|uniref:hypothetical protein n=1 Tax=Albirhodobacter sp. R86504 TaxID=3093848 RepID=UPI00366FE73F
MINDFISMIAAAVLAVICVYIANHLSRKLRGTALPKWAMPAAAGVAMLGYTVYAEYRWFPDLAAKLPAQTVIAQQVESRMIYRPWTFLVPLTTRFIALDRIVPEGDFRRADLLLIARWKAPLQVPVVFDCAQSKRADLIEGAQLEAGVLTGAQWITLPAQDPVLQAACEA